MKRQLNIPQPDDWISLATIGDLKKYIKDLPDDLPIYQYQNDTAYDLEVYKGDIECIEHSGRIHTQTGLWFEVDG